VLIEINEETGLSSNDIVLIRTGKPIIIRAESISTIWKVHPFLFQLVSKDLKRKIKIDWEHQELQWIKPNELNNFIETVPNLKDTFYRVYLPNNVHQGILNISHDRISGAQQLANKALDIFYNMIKSNSYDNEYVKDHKSFLTTLLNVGWHLVQARHSMRAPISYVVTILLKQVLKISDKYVKNTDNDVDDYEKGMRKTFSLDKYKEMVLEKIVELKTKSKESNQKIIDNFMNILSSNIQKTKSDITHYDNQLFIYNLFNTFEFNSKIHK